MPATPESTNPDPHSRTPSCKDEAVETLHEGPYDGRVPPPPSAAACAESAAASALSATASAERASAAAETAAAAAAMAAANAESARAVIHVTDVALARVEAIHAKIEDAHTKIFQATSDSSMQPTSEKAAVAMEHLLPHEVAERELEMQEAAEIEERREEELRVA